MKRKAADTRRFGTSLRVGVVGCGNIASVHLRYVTKYVDPRAVALCDLNRVRMEALAEVFGISTVYSELGAMLEEFRPHVVHISTPPRTHKEIALTCLRQNAHVFIEKPMCMYVDEVKEIMEASLASERQVCVDHLRMYDPLVTKARYMLESGGFGRIVNVSVNESDNYLDRKRAGLAPGWLTSLPGEILYDLLPHHLSLMDEFLAEPRLGGVVHRRTEEDEISDLHCLFASAHGTGSIHLSLSTLPLRNDMTLECTEGLIYVDFRNQVIVSKKKSGLPSAAARVADNIGLGKQFIFGTMGSVFQFLRGRLDTYAGLEVTIRKFYEALNDNGSSPVPVKKGLYVVGAMEEIFNKLGQSDGEASAEAKERTLEHSEKPSLREADVLVTGGTGFIGSKLVRRLVEKGYRVRVLTHREPRALELKGLSEDRVDLLQGDVSDARDVMRVCHGVGTVYHLAAATKGNWLCHLDVSVTGTQNVVDACIKEGVKRLVYVSTISLLNQSRYPRNGLIDEDFPYEKYPERRGAYTHAKLKAEKIVRDCMENNPGISVAILRPGLVYGPGKNLVQDVARRVSEGLVVVFGSGRRLLPLVYVENLVDALVMAGESDKSGIFNVIDDDTVTERKMINAHKKLTGEHFHTVYVPMPVLKMLMWGGDIVIKLMMGKPPSLLYKIKCVSRRVRFNTDRISNALGWRSRVSFEQGLVDTVNALQDEKGS